MHRGIGIIADAGKTPAVRLFGRRRRQALLDDLLRRHGKAVEVDEASAVNERRNVLGQALKHVDPGRVVVADVQHDRVTILSDLVGQVMLGGDARGDFGTVTIMTVTTRPRGFADWSPSPAQTVPLPRPSTGSPAFSTAMAMAAIVNLAVVTMVLVSCPACWRSL